MQHDLLQLAVYAELLSLSKPGLRFHGCLEYYEPELHAVEVARPDLQALFEQQVRPILYEIVAEKPPSPRSEAEPPAATPAARSTSGPPAADLSAEIQACFSSFKLEVAVLGYREAPQLIRYQVRPAPGVKVVSLANRAEDLKVALSLPQTPVIEPARGSVVIDIPKDRPDTVYWRDVIEDPQLAGHPSPVAFPVGRDVNNRIISADFADPNMCHCLVAGVAGSGKSEFLKSMVASLIRRNSAETLALTVIDPKVLTFGSLPENLPQLTGAVITDAKAAIPCLGDAVQDMQGRYRRLAEEGFENLAERQRAGKTDIPYRVIVFDEFADLIMAGKTQKKEFERLVARLAQMGRAAGIHLVLSTQRPDRTVVTGIIKANLPLKICMRVTNAANSSIVLDQTGGEKLLGRGDLLCDRGRGVERAQSPYVTQAELRQLFNQS
jgi:S-DNA-T family DNA segregation ATPase FtsK/SpoIIIE